MIAKLTALGFAALAAISLTAAQAQTPKSGGILHIYHRETPPSLRGDGRRMAPTTGYCGPGPERTSGRQPCASAPGRSRGR